MNTGRANAFSPRLPPHPSADGFPHRPRPSPSALLHALPTGVLLGLLDAHHALSQGRKNKTAGIVTIPAGAPSVACSGKPSTRTPPDDEPQTAYQRLLAPGDLTAKARRHLRERFEALDPFALAREVERRLRPILSQALPLGAEPQPFDAAGPPQNGTQAHAASRKVEKRHGWQRRYPVLGRPSSSRRTKKHGSSYRDQLNQWCHFAVRQRISI